MVGSQENRVRELMRAVDQADSAEGLLRAVEALAAVADQVAVPKLIEVLGFNNPGAAVAAVEGLIAVGEPAVLPLMEQLDGYNYGARAWAIRALSGIGDPRSLEILWKAAVGDFALSVRRAAARGLGMIHWELFPNEGVPGVQSLSLKEAKDRTMEVLLKTSWDPEWVVRYAAIVGLEGLAKSRVELPDTWLPKLEERLNQIIAEDEVLAVRGRGKMAQEMLTEWMQNA